MRLQLAPTPAAPSAARRALEPFRATLPPSVVQDATLVLSELVTNSVVHAMGPITVEAREITGGMRISVRDTGRGIVDALRDERRTPRRSGYGMLLLDRLADRWGMRFGRGTAVWFEIRSRPRARNHR